jgi:hypothetical protein
LRVNTSDEEDGRRDDSSLHARCRSDVVAGKSQTFFRTARSKAFARIANGGRAAVLRERAEAREKAMSVDLAQVIPPLVRAKVDFILIGGMAGILHGSARVTFDVMTIA